MLALHRGEVSGVVSGLHAGTSGTLLVLLICVLYAPTAVVWGTSYLVGPGFAVGTGTTVAITGVHLGAVPAAPAAGRAAVLAGRGGAALASHGRGDRWRPGSSSGMLVDRAARREPGQPISSWRDLLRVARLTGRITGLALGVLAAASIGPAGPGRLAHTGPGAVVGRPGRRSSDGGGRGGHPRRTPRELFRRAAR